MSKTFGIAALVAGALILTGACIGSEDPKLGKVREEYLAMSEAGSGSFADQVSASALKHLQQVAKENREGNWMISPFSLQECLGMVRLGAVGETNSELAEWLGADTDPGATSVLAGGFRKQLSPLMQAGVFSTANGLWVEAGDSFLPDYLAVVKKDYDGGAKTFSSTSQALEEVNSFVKEGTMGMIPKLLEELDPSTAAVLVNAVSFKDKWEVPFDKAKTVIKDFQTPEGARKVPMMAGKKGFFAKEVDGFILGSGSFKTGLKITFALPPSPRDPPESCFPALLEAAKEGITEPARAFEIPRLKSGFKWNLKKTMMDMGVVRAFGPGADFSKMMGGGVFISEALQKTFVEFDEEGVKAAAATAVTMTKSAPPRGDVAFVADRPFAYVIHDAKGMPFFAGVVRDPRSPGED